MFHNRSWNDVWTIDSAAFAVLALYCVVQHLFAYNYAVGNVPYIPLMLGSYIYMSYLVSAAFLLRLALRPQSPHVMNELAVVASFLVLAILVMLFSDDKARSYSFISTGSSVMQTNLRYLAGHTLAFVVGFSLKDLGRFRNLIVTGFFLLVANALMNVDSRSMLLNLEVKDEDFKGIYLMLGDTFGMWAVLTCAVVESRRGRVILVTVAVVALAVLNSRTSLYAFIVTIPFVFRMTPLRSTVIIAAIVAVVLSVTSPLVGQKGLVDRMFGSLISGEDSSMNSRMDQFESGLRGLSEHWFLGDYAGQVRDFGEIGAYMHNILSYWRQFGLLPFLLVLILWWRAAQRARRCLTDNEAWADPDLRFFILAFVFFGFEALSSRSYGYSLQWLVLGQSTALLVRQRYHTAADTNGIKYGEVAPDYS